MNCTKEDYKAFEAVYKFIKDVKPQRVIMMGDSVDFYSLSKFDKSPDRLDSLQEEIDILHYHLGRLREVFKGRIDYLEGNHEQRLIKYLRRHPEMHSLRVLSSPASLLELDSFDVKYHKNLMIHGVLFKHGHMVRKHSGYTARGELETEGVSGISAHTHRLSSHYLTTRGGTFVWHEMGHLCDVSSAEYLNAKIPNWQEGFGMMLYDKKNKVWTLEQYPITHNHFIAQGKTYSWRNNMSVPERERIL